MLRRRSRWPTPCSRSFLGSHGDTETRREVQGSLDRATDRVDIESAGSIGTLRPTLPCGRAATTDGSPAF
jgi:hypothetical protein